MLSLLLLAAACGSESGPAPEGGLLLTMVTSGADLDPNGYAVALDGGMPTAVPANGSATFEEAAPGAHALSVTDVDETCALQEQVPFPFSVTEGAQVKVTLHVTCAFANTLAYIQDDTIYVTFADSGAVPRQIGEGYQVLRWSPDGSALALVGEGSVYLADAGGGNIRVLWSSDPRILLSAVTDFLWAPDGRSLLIEIFYYHAFVSSLARLDLSRADSSGGFENVPSCGWSHSSALGHLIAAMLPWRGWLLETGTLSP